MFLNQNLRLFPIQHGYTSTPNLCHICPAHPFPKHSLLNNTIYKKKLYHNLCIRGERVSGCVGLGACTLDCRCFKASCHCQFSCSLGTSPGEVTVTEASSNERTFETMCLNGSMLHQSFISPSLLISTREFSV